MTSFLIALVISICGLSSNTAHNMSNEALYNELGNAGYSTEQVNAKAAEQEENAEYADGSGIDLE